MTLKNICNSLSRRPQALDVIMLFRGTKQILQPLCTLLDSWRWDGDQGENQPVYDEFGSILLLVLEFKHRYDLKPFDLGISSNDSFVLKLLDRGSCSQKLEDLTEKQNKDLGAWIGALFIAEGISEETMANCSPQEFYMLVTTLFSQSLGACEAGKLEFDTLKGGFECRSLLHWCIWVTGLTMADLLEPFLLPSLVVALGWLGNRIWESESEPTIPLKTLHSLVSPSSISGEAQAIHQTVLNMTARTLEEQLKDVRARHPSRPDIKPIIDALEPYLSFQRTGNCHRSELESWTTHPSGGAGGEGGLLGSLRNTFQSLVLWSTNPEISMAPPSYTHRQVLAGVRILGAPRVLRALGEELKLQNEAGSGDLALDIMATIISAPMAESFALDQHHHHQTDTNKDQQQQQQPQPAPSSLRCPILTLRDALNLQHENVPRISEKDPLRAEIIVRLSRRVNALTAPTAQVPNVDLNNIIGNMPPPPPTSSFEPQVQVQGPMDLDPSSTDRQDGGGGDGGLEEPENLSQMLDNATAAAAAGEIGGVGEMGEMGEMGEGTGLDTNIDDVLNAADMAAVGNPEFLDLDMEEMFS